VVSQEHGQPWQGLGQHMRELMILLKMQMACLQLVANAHHTLQVLACLLQIL